MSKGCFIKFIVILTIVVAGISYVVQTKFDDWIVSPGKKLIKKAFNENWNEELAFVRQSTEKDSVKILIEDYIDRIDPDSISDEKVDVVKNAVEAVAADSTIDRHDLETIKNLLRAEK